MDEHKSTSAIERIIARLRKCGFQFPVNREELHGFAGQAAVRALARRGLVRHGELFDGALPNGIAHALEKAGITSRAGFLQRYWAKRIKVSALPGIGPLGAKKVLAWADMPVAADETQVVPLDLTRETWRGLDRLVKHRQLSGRAELITRLVAEELQRLPADTVGESNEPLSRDPN